MRTGGRTIRVALGAVVLLAAGAVRADGPTPGGDGPLETRILDVGALSHGHHDFIPDRGPFGPATDQVNDEANPLFGGEAQETEREAGTVEDLIELVKSSAPPGTWEREGSTIAAMGSDRIVMRASKSTCDAAGALLSRTEKDALGVVTVDVLALEGDPAAASTEGGVAGAIARGTLRIVGAARTSGLSGQRVTALSGGFHAYLADYSVEVAQDAKTVNPFVNVQPDGLCVDATARIAQDHVSLDVKAWFARIDGIDPRVTSGGDAFEALRVDGRQASATLLRAKPGEWALLPATGGSSFAVRASLRAATEGVATSAFPTVVGGKAEGALVRASIPIHDLAQRIANYRGAAAMLYPSNYVLPEPPELSEPAPIFPPDSLVEFIKGTIDPAGWEREGSSLELKNGILHVSGSETQVKGIESFLAELRRRYQRAYRAKAVVVSLPIASFPELATGVDDASELVKDGGAALLARSGARVEDKAAVRLGPRGRMGRSQGKLHRYVGDYDVSIAEKSAIGNPKIFGAMEGTSFDVEAEPAAGGTALRCEVRFDYSTWRAQREVKTRHGDIDLPDLGVQRMRGSCVVPLGATRLLSVGIEGDRVVLVLMTVNEG